MKSETPSDEDLIRGCRENRRKSQEMLYRRYARIMYNLCLIYESDREKAKDILQESFIKIFRNISGFDSKGSLAGWLKKIITHTAIDHYRKNNRESQFIPIENTAYPVAVEETVDSDLNTEDIISLVDRLPCGARMIFRLFAIEGYSHKEIAGLLHISEGTSKSQISRAKQLLQHWMVAGKISLKPIEG